MNRRFLKYLRIVAACHFGALVVMLTTSGWTGLFHRTPDLIVPVEFVVEVPGEVVPHSKAPLLEPKQEESKGPDESNLDSLNIEPVKKKKNIERSTKKITRIPGAAGGGGAKKTNLTPEEIKRFLDMGAKASDHTSIPGDEEVRCFEIVRRTMYEAWNQPGTEDAGNAVAEITIGLSRDGGILWRKMSKKSGNAIFDESVMHGVNSVEFVEHLTPAFLDKHREIRITFKLD
ncbi:MAG: TonB C-terminal domain-containing protein [Kiritimatiellae bacterium]|nr:TonB C-terminal domain-containing protein [Kiritimatiellia bacterium]MDD5521018.1 TonB C-terminal domain-containing protein [Kiritimatiellia bacterium]